MAKIFKIFLTLLITLSVVSCGKPKEEIMGKSNVEIMNCLKNNLQAYITTEKEGFTNLDQIEFTSLNTKLSYFNAGMKDKENMYAIVNSNEFEVIKDFNMYFSQKYSTYLSYNLNDWNIFVHNELNDMNMEELKQCITEPLQEKGKEIKKSVINKLNDTNKIVIKISDKELKTISNKEDINTILDIIKESKQYGNAFLCDGHSFDFEMYNDDKLIDTVYIWGDGKRLIPSSISGGCSYYSSNEDMRKLINHLTDYKFFLINDFTTNEQATNELIYQTNNHKYYLKNRKSSEVLVKFSLTNLNMTLEYALKNNYLDLTDIQDYNLILEK